MPNAPSRLSLLVPLVALFFASGCVIEHGGHDWDEDEYSYCEDSTDCRYNQFCRNGTCRDIDANAQRCTSGSQCGWGESCIDGVCCQSCDQDSDCSGGGRCGNDNYCDPKPPAQDGGTPIPDGGSCQQPEPTCRQNSDCGYGNYCINAACVRGCSTNTQCSANETCQSGLCRPAPLNQCTTNAQCPASQDCVDGQCRASCSYASQCPSGYSCQIGYCLPGSGSGSGQVCNVSCDCPSGERCVGGRCSL